MDKFIVNNTNNSKINIYRKDNLENFPKTIDISNVKTFQDLFKQIDKNYIPNNISVVESIERRYAKNGVNTK